MITLELTPTEEAQIASLARQIGLPPAEYARKLLTEQLPPLDVSRIIPMDDENARAIAQLQVYLQAEATDDPEEIRIAQAELNDLMNNLNRNRVESGERSLFA